jgi:hypothetical protein
LALRLERRRERLLKTKSVFCIAGKRAFVP